MSQLPHRLLARDRTRTKLCAVAVCAMVLAGCGSDPCSDGSSANQAVANKIANCSSQNSSFFGGFSPGFDQNACETSLKSCTPTDRHKLEATVACQNEYAGNDDCSYAALQKFYDCAGSATTAPDGGSSLSPACAEAFDSHQVAGTPDGGM